MSMQEELRREVEAAWGKPLPPAGSPEEAELVDFLRTHRPDLLEAWYAFEGVPEEQERQVRAREASRRVRRALLYEEDENHRPFLSKSKASNLFLAGLAALVFGVMGVFLYGLYRGGEPQQTSSSATAPAISPSPPQQVPAPSSSVEPPSLFELPLEPSPPSSAQEASSGFPVPQPPELPSLEGVPPPPGAFSSYVSERQVPQPVAVTVPSEGTSASLGVAAFAQGEGAAPVASQVYVASPLAVFSSGTAAAPSPLAFFAQGQEVPPKPSQGEAPFAAGAQGGPDLSALDSALAAMRASASPSSKSPDLRPGVGLSVFLPFDLVLVSGSEVQLLLEGENVLFLGRARVEGGLVRIVVDKAILSDGREVGLVGQVVGSSGQYVVPEVQDLAPSLAQDLLRGALGGLVAYVDDLRSQRRVVVGQGGNVVVESQAPGLLEQVVAGVAQVLRLPQGTASLVRVYRVPKGTRFTLWVMRVEREG